MLELKKLTSKQLYENNKRAACAVLFVMNEHAV